MFKKIKSFFIILWRELRVFAETGHRRFRRNSPSSFPRVFVGVFSPFFFFLLQETISIPVFTQVDAGSLIVSGNLDSLMVRMLTDEVEVGGYGRR